VLTSGDGDSGDAVSAPAATPSKPIPVGNGPTGLAAGPARMWVAARDEDEIDGINLDDGQLEYQVTVPDPKAVAVGHDSIWAVSASNDALYRIDAIEQQPPLPIALPGCGPVDVVTDAESVWVACEGTQRVVRVDPGSNEVAGAVRLGTPPRALASGAGSVWVTNDEAATVSRINPDAVKLEGTAIEVGTLPNDIAVGAGAVWVTSFANGTVTRIDPEAGAVSGEPIAVGPTPRGVAAGLGYVWVALGDDDEVVRIDPESGSLAGHPIPVGDDPADVALAPTTVWVANEGDSTVSRIKP